ncbi:MAG: dTDP-4-dehydrorhamnose 3,5-epimerase [Deltaproteobacteria bacterium]|nr:dTDP-4-dehydrorhamnose 3,5-epimerase [Deltaproteobacteria bacterium]
MIFTETPLKGACLIDPERKEDHRGFFARSWCREEFERHGLDPGLAQINLGFSGKKGTLRGMHYQVAPDAEIKVVRCTSGAIFDVIIDLRPDSETLGKWFGVELNCRNRSMLYVPEGFAHGYQTLESNSEMYYMTSKAYAQKSARGCRYNDPAFGIAWPLPVECISDADASWPDYRT